MVISDQTIKDTKKENEDLKAALERSQSFPSLNDLIAEKDRINTFFHEKISTLTRQNEEFMKGRQVSQEREEKIKVIQNEKRVMQYRISSLEKEVLLLNNEVQRLVRKK